VEGERVVADQVTPSVSVVIVSWRRPDYVRSCLESLRALSPGPEEIVVVDASSDDATRLVVAEFPGVEYVPFPRGAGHMTTSRNVGLLHVSGDIIAFLDDDTVAHDAWLEGVVSAFGDEAVGALAGRTCNGQPGESEEGVEDMGRLLPDGRLTGFFAADPGRVVEVAHGIGANMAFRSGVLGELGGFRDDFRGVGGVREDTDVFFRVGALGYRIVFSPDAAVDHLGAPHVRGRRFDFRYMFWARHNHALLLGRNFGLGSTYFRAWFRGELTRAIRTHHGNPLRRVVRVPLAVSAIGAGVFSAALKGRWRSSNPRRSDDLGDRIRSHLLGRRSRPDQ
jgi:GT2 family glycosyltransferase